jgi:hypothetical protein
VRRQAKAPSAITAASTGTTPARRAVFGLVCLCVLGLAAFLGSGAPAAGAAEGFPGRGFLPDNRAWELATPGTDIDVMGRNSVTQAARGESPGLPMAIRFASLGGSAGVEGMGVAVDYIAAREGAAGTSGWAIHGITPPQEAKTYETATSRLNPSYDLLSDDLTTAVFRSFSSLPGTSDNVWEVPNLYRRADARTPGPGAYQLLTDSAFPQPPLSEGFRDIPFLDGASSDLQHVIFETKLNLSADATGSNLKLYKSDGGAPRLLSANDSCPDAKPSEATSVCSIAGLGLGTFIDNPRYMLNVISDDGSRVNLTSPTGLYPGFATGEKPGSRPGVVSKLYQLDDLGTAATDDDAVIQLSMSENPTPEPAALASYQTASTDGKRVFFQSGEQLTETSGSGLYMWERQSQDETQEVNVDATGGQFTLTAHTQPSHGVGQLTENDTTVMMTEDPGSFTVGQTIEGEGIPAGTTVESVGRFNTESEKKIVISNPATETATRALTASFEATTDPLPWNATATQVEAELEGLSSIGTGNVSVGGGPGGSAAFEVTFTGALAGVNVMPLTADQSGLSGGASTVVVTTTGEVHNLTLIGAGAEGVVGASDDGRRVYFSIDDDIWLWQDAKPGPDLYHVAQLRPGDTRANVATSASWGRLVSNVTPDGRFLLFEATNGSTLPPAYQHGACAAANPNANGPTEVSMPNPCSEAYLYSADTSTPSQADIVCASCDLSKPGASGNAYLGLNVSSGLEFSTGISPSTMYLHQSLTDDGRRVFFNTPEALVPEDTNGQSDVYQYDRLTAQTRLISSGTDFSPSFFMDASDDGSDVFILTRAQLSGWDNDQAFDLYDARVDGGFPEPPAGTAGCNGADSCRVPAAPQPPPPGIGSSAISGPGDPKRPCRKGTRRVKKAGKVRCVKKHRKHHRRHANNDRRAGK